MTTAVMPSGPPRPLRPGDSIGNYKIERQLGEGGMGTVYRAVHQLIGSRAVIKVLHATYAANQDIAARFVNEARAVTSLKHRNIVTVFDCGIAADGRLYIAMEYLDGSTLAAFLASLGGPLDLPTALALVAQAANGLQCAHEHGIVHRDIKPENLFLTFTAANPKHVTILDFGISKVDDDNDQVRTGTNVVIGTPPYMAPEQLRASKDVDGRADVYALAVVAWEMLTGERLWAHVPSPSAIIEQQILDVGRVNPSRTLASIPPEVGAVVARGLAYHPADRWDSPRAFAVALAHACPATEWSENGIEIVRRLAPELMLAQVDDDTAGRPTETATPTGPGAPAPVWGHAHRTPLPQPRPRADVATAAVAPGPVPLVTPAPVAAALAAGPGARTTLGAAAGQQVRTPAAQVPTRPGHRRARLALAGLVAAGTVVAVVALAARGGEGRHAAAGRAPLVAVDAGTDAAPATDAGTEVAPAAPLDAPPAGRGAGRGVAHRCGGWPPTPTTPPARARAVTARRRHRWRGDPVTEPRSRPHDVEVGSQAWDTRAGVVPGKRTLADRLPPARPGVVSSGPQPFAQVPPSREPVDDPYGFHLLNGDEPGALGAAPGGSSAAGRRSITMRVRALRRRGPAKQWSGVSADVDLDGVKLTASRQGGAWVWSDDRGSTIEIRAGGPGRPGVSIEAWAPSDAYTIVVAYGSASEADLGEGHGTGGDGGERDTGNTSDAASSAPSTGPRGADATTSPPVGGHESDAPGEGQGDDPAEPAHDHDASIADDPEEAVIDADSDDALDAQIAALLASLGMTDDEGEAGGDGNGLADQAHDGPSNDGRRGDHAQDGSKDGREFEGRSDPGATAHDDRTGGDHDAPDGRELGEEGGREGGVLGAPSFHFFGLQIAVPASLAGAVEVALILSEGDVLGFGAVALKTLVKSAARRGLGRAARSATVVAIRKELRRKASEQVAQRMRKVNREIALALRTPADQLTRQQRRLVAQWSRLTREEIKRAQRITTWELQRRYFQQTLETARAEAKQLRRAARRTKDLGRRADLAARAEQVEAVAEAAQAQPIAGRLPIGHRYAGQEFPRELLPKRFRERGLKIDADGFPDFEPHTLTLPNGKKSVTIELTGSRDADFAAANAAAGFKRTPPGYTWHHHQRYGDMTLVPTDLHDAVKHSGGVAVHRHAHGMETYGE